MPDPAAPRFVDRAGDLPALAEFAALSGMEIMQGILTGRLPAPPICRTMGFRLTEISEGRAVFEGEPGFEHYIIMCSAECMGAGSGQCSTVAWVARCIPVCRAERATRRWSTR